MFEVDQQDRVTSIEINDNPKEYFIVSILYR